MPAKAKSAAVLAKEAADAAAAGTLSDSFEDAKDVVQPAISIFAHMRTGLGVGST